jgi:peroxiredoxin
VLAGWCDRGTAATAAAPTPDTAQAAASPLRLGVYRATLTLPGGELPFGLEIEREHAAYVAYLINGPERVRVPEVAVTASRVDMLMPGYLNQLTANISGDSLDGSVTLVKSGGRKQVIPFKAQHGLQYRFLATPAGAHADFSGRWAVTFTDETAASEKSVGEFRQTRQHVTGTFLAPSGDHRYLAGEAQGDQLMLSAFDGAHALLYRAHLDQHGALSGILWSGLASKENFSGMRDANASLGDAERATAMRGAARKLDFSFANLDGKSVSLTDKRFRGKVVIVTLAGSWCPNCHDEAAFLAPYYLRNRARGLEVVSLMFEQYGDLPQARAATKRFRAEYGIRYTTLIAGVSDRDDAAKKLPQLNGVFAFPTTIFVDRQGAVRQIHTGFSGPATGAHYEKLKHDFEVTVEQLLAESARRGDTHAPAC